MQLRRACVFVVALGACGPRPAPTASPAVVHDGGIVIRAGDGWVLPEAMPAARAELEKMIGRAPRIRRNLEARRFEFVVVSRYQLFSDLDVFKPEKGSRVPDGTDYDEHVRGAGHQRGHTLACSEENLLQFRGTKWFAVDACSHELGHSVMWTGMSPEARLRVLEVYEASRGKWANTYTGSNFAEYWANLSTWYFGSWDPGTRIPGVRRGPEWLQSYDPAGYALVDAFYTDRADPGVATRRPLPVRPARDEATTRSATTRRPVIIEIANETGASLETFWLDFDGRRQPGNALPPHLATTHYTSTGHAFVIADGTEKAVALVVAGEEDGYAEITTL